MKLKVLNLFMGLVCLSFAQVAMSQGANPTQGSQALSLDSLGVNEYLLGPGDELEIKFFQQPDMNTTASVGANGTIKLPFLKKPIQAGCKTDREVEDEVSSAYEKFFTNPQVSVRVIGKYSRPPVAVYGAVRDPQRVQALRRIRLNELISYSGGTTEKSNGSIQVIHTAPAMCPDSDKVEGGLTSTEDVGVMKVYRLTDIVGGKNDANPFVRPGDVVMALEAEPVLVLGDVSSPQKLYLTPGLTFQRAMALVGGPLKSANASKIAIQRQDPITNKITMIVVDYSAITKLQKPDIELKPYDVIFVPEASLLAGQNILSTLLKALMGSFSAAMTAPAQALPVTIH